jgi:nicotinamide mononucleotide transporter
MTINIISFLDINNVFFTVLGYDMSYIEFFGTLLNILSVYLVSKNKILNWPVGIIASVLFMFLFWQIQLYSDFTEQLYYIVTCFWGWSAWKNSSSNNLSGQNILKISNLEIKEKILFSGIVLIGTILLGLFMANIDKLLPTLFSVAATYVFLDAFTTVLSFLATYLLIKRKIESWYIWIFVDVIAVWLYYVKDVKFVALLYIVFLILATYGLLTWKKIMLQQKYDEQKI